MLLQPARLTLDANGQPRSDHYQDIYYNPGAGFAESEHVFIHGNRLHERLAHARDLTIGEILVEIVASSKGDGFLEAQPLTGPYPSGAPAATLLV